MGLSPKNLEQPYPHQTVFLRQHELAERLILEHGGLKAALHYALVGQQPSVSSLSTDGEQWWRGS